MASALEAIRYRNQPKPALEILDQLQLPHKTVYLQICSAKDGWKAIKTMSTRGAPAIAIVAALSLAVELANAASIQSGHPEAAKDFIHKKLTYLVTSRPTAVNLEDAARKLSAEVTASASATDATGESVVQSYILAAEAMLLKDVQDNEAIGRSGADWMVRNIPNSNKRKMN